MPRRFTAAMLLLLALANGMPAAAAERAVPHGVRFEEEGQTVLVLRGSHRERGEALGRLAGTEIVRLVREYGLRLLPASRFSVARSAAPFALSFPGWAREEARGVIAGMDAAEVSRSLPALGRSLDALDLLLLTIVPDIGVLACSSLSAWGDALRRQPDGDAAAGPLLARNLDFTLPPEAVDAVRAAQAVIVHVPTDPGEHAFLSVGLAGFLGVLSGFDASGRGAFLNLDLSAEPVPLRRILGRRAMPTAIALREGLERRDHDGNGERSLSDITAALRAHPRFGAVLVHAVTARPRAEALVIEADAEGVTERRPAPAADHLVLTNHARVRRPPSACDRFDALERGATRRDGHLDGAVLHQLLATVAFRERTVRTLETMVYDARAGRIGVGFLGSRGHAGGAPLVWHALAPLVKHTAAPPKPPPGATEVRR